MFCVPLLVVLVPVLTFDSLRPMTLISYFLCVTHTNFTNIVLFRYYTLHFKIDFSRSSKISLNYLKDLYFVYDYYKFRVT